MIGVYTGIALAALAAVWYAFSQRKTAMLEADNTKLRDQVVECRADQEVQTLENKVKADEKESAPIEAKYADFVAKHPELFVSKPNGKS